MKPSGLEISDEAIRLGLKLNNLFYNLLTIEKVLADDNHLQDLIAARSKLVPEEFKNDTFYLDRRLITQYEERRKDKGQIPVREVVYQYSDWSDMALAYCALNIDNLWNVPVYNQLCEQLAIIKQVRLILESVNMPYASFENAQRQNLYEDIHDIRPMIDK